MNKKKYSQMVVTLLLLSAVCSFVPAVSAIDQVCTVRGYVLVDGVATEAQEIVLLFPETLDIVCENIYDDGYYEITDEMPIGETGIFHVTITGGTWQAETQEPFVIEQGNPLYRGVDLLINTSLPPLNNAPSVPSVPSGPSSGKTGNSYSFSTSSIDPEGDQIYYKWNVSGTETEWLGPFNSGASHSKSFSWSTEGTYEITVKAKDNFDAETVWSGVKTIIISEPQDDPSPPYHPPSAPPSIQYPIANLSGSDNFGFVGDNLTFDGRQSRDPGGSIVSYHWDFDDGTNSTLNLTSHAFASEGSYEVTLTVTDNQGYSDSETITVVISKANTPPTAPVLSGEDTIEALANYTLSMISTDADGDDLTYTVVWGDGESDTTESVSENVSTTLNHAFDAAGVYTISVTADDNETSSSASTMMVYVDAIGLMLENESIGYATDDNGDGVFDTFHPTSGSATVLSVVDGTYMVDSDGDEVTDYTFSDPVPPEVDVDEYEAPSEAAEQDYTWLYVIVILLILVLLLLLLRRDAKEADETEEEPEPVEEKQEKPKKEQSKKKSSSSKKSKK